MLRRGGHSHLPPAEFLAVGAQRHWSSQQFFALRRDRTWEDRILPAVIAAPDFRLRRMVRTGEFQRRKGRNDPIVELLSGPFADAGIIEFPRIEHLMVFGGIDDLELVIAGREFAVERQHGFRRRAFGPTDRLPVGRHDPQLRPDRGTEFVFQLSLPQRSDDFALSEQEFERGKFFLDPERHDLPRRHGVLAVAQREDQPVIARLRQIGDHILHLRRIGGEGQHLFRDPHRRGHAVAPRGVDRINDLARSRRHEFNLLFELAEIRSIGAQHMHRRGIPPHPQHGVAFHFGILAVFGQTGVAADFGQEPAAAEIEPDRLFRQSGEAERTPRNRQFPGPQPAVVDLHRHGRGILPRRIEIGLVVDRLQRPARHVAGKAVEMFPDLQIELERFAAPHLRFALRRPLVAFADGIERHIRQPRNEADIEIFFIARQPEIGRRQMPGAFGVRPIDHRHQPGALLPETFRQLAVDLQRPRCHRRNGQFRRRRHRRRLRLAPRQRGDFRRVQRPVVQPQFPRVRVVAPRFRIEPAVHVRPEMDLAQIVGRERHRLFGLFLQHAVDVDPDFLPVPAYRGGHRSIELDRLGGAEIILFPLGRIVGKADEQFRPGLGAEIDRQRKGSRIAHRQEVAHFHLGIGVFALFEAINHRAFIAQQALGRNIDAGYPVAPVTVGGEIAVKVDLRAFGGGDDLRTVEFHMERLSRRRGRKPERTGQCGSQEKQNLFHVGIFLWY
ncbi:hypothetical protein SDC9_81000 [bioreactor metagenome]|uniref:Uncharacterized protein n=1 Tax=bioreactor metagenome TaxID=1076179 RepID=A0A644Z1C7_9ZZZZ